jgi:hypothetical protein
LSHKYFLPLRVGGVCEADGERVGERCSTIGFLTFLVFTLSLLDLQIAHWNHKPATQTQRFGQDKDCV